MSAQFWIDIAIALAGGGAVFGLARLIQVALMPRWISVADVLLWAEDVKLSSAQLQKTYEWRIDQWASASRSFLTSGLALASGMVLSVFRGQSIIESHPALAMAALIGPALGYVLCQQIVSRARDELLILYSLLRALR